MHHNAIEWIFQFPTQRHNDTTHVMKLHLNAKGYINRIGRFICLQSICCFTWMQRSTTLFNRLSWIFTIVTITNLAFYVNVNLELQFLLCRLLLLWPYLHLSIYRHFHVAISCVQITNPSIILQNATSEWKSERIKNKLWSRSSSIQLKALGSDLRPHSPKKL